MKNAFCILWTRTKNGNNAEGTKQSGVKKEKKCKKMKKKQTKKHRDPAGNKLKENVIKSKRNRKRENKFVLSAVSKMSPSVTSKDNHTFYCHGDI